MKKIGIILICSNIYFILGLRFVKTFMKHYKGKQEIQFYLFTDTDPTDYLPNINVNYINTNHNSWIDATNSRYENVLKLKNSDCDYFFHVDADTNVYKDFDESFFLGDLVGLEHFGNKNYMKDEKHYDRNKNSAAYIPFDTPLKQIYFHGSFFGGKKEKILELCKDLLEKQKKDKLINYEPRWNDESFLNNYFHYNSPNLTIYCENFPFGISCKGGINDTRNTNINCESMKNELLQNKYRNFNLNNGKIIYID